MDARSHRIGELCFRLRAADGDAAERWGHAVRAMAETRLLPLIEKEFDRLAEDRVIVLDRLELDLGDLGAEPSALGAALSAALARLKVPGQGQGPDRSLADPVSLIIGYLREGGLPLPGPASAVRAAWAELALLPPHRLARALSRLAPSCVSVSAARRLVASAPPGLLSAMAFALAGWSGRHEAGAATRVVPEGPVLEALRGLALAPESQERAVDLAVALGGRPGPADPGRGRSVPARVEPIAVVPGAADDPRPHADPAGDVPLAVPAAGLVLLHPFLPTYFESLGLLAGPGRFADRHARSLAIRLAQRLATGEDSASEADCVLAKLLCGLAPEDALLSEGPHPVSEARIAEEASALLAAVIAHWSRLGRTSPEGLREAFLRRPGVVKRVGDGWRLTVERRGTDVLLDSLPWTLGLVRTPFMTTLLRVDWR